MNCCCCCPMVSSSSAFDDDDDDDDVSLLLSKSVSSSSSPSSFFFESATKRILFRRPRCVRPRSKRVVLARVERRTLRFEKVEDDDDDENHGAERTAPPPTRTVKEDVMFPREHYTTLCRLSRVKVFPTIDAEVSRAVFSQSARCFEIQFKCGEKRTAFSPKIRCCEQRERRATPTTTPSEEEENQDQHSEEVKANTTRNGRRNTS